MKKKILFATMIALAIVGCSKNDDTDDETNTPDDNGAVVTPGEDGEEGEGEETDGSQLATPSNVALSATEVEEGTDVTLSWDAVENADSYEVYSNSAEYATTSETSYTLSGLTAGTYSLKVQALAAEGSDYTDSDLSSALLLTVTAQETEPEETYEWTTVPTDAVTKWGAKYWESLTTKFGGADVEWTNNGGADDPYVSHDGYLAFNAGSSKFKVKESNSVYCLQYGGTGSLTKCNIQFKVTTGGTLKVFIKTSSNSSDRYLTACVGEDTTDLFNGEAKAPAKTDDEDVAPTAEYSCELTDISSETTITLFCTDSGILLYEAAWIPTGVEDTVVDWTGSSEE